MSLVQVDPYMKIAGKMEDEVPAFFKRMRYPFAISKSALFAVGSPHTWPGLLAALVWLTDLLYYTQKAVSPFPCYVQQHHLHSCLTRLQMKVPNPPACQWHCTRSVSSSVVSRTGGIKALRLTSSQAADALAESSAGCVRGVALLQAVTRVSELLTCMRPAGSQEHVRGDLG